MTSPKIKKIKKKIIRKSYTIQKKIVLGFKEPYSDTLPVFILGCGRSGTTMMLDIFHRDTRIETLGEKDTKIAGKNFMLHYNKIGPAIRASKAPILVMKPILNSFDAKKLLTQYEKAVVLWIVRDYRDMIASSMKKFGDRVAAYIRNFIMHDKGDNWIVSGMKPETKKHLKTLEFGTFSDIDWMGLVWWSVNQTVLSDGLDRYEGFHLVNYESFVNDEDALKKIYGILGLDLKLSGSKLVHSKSIGKGHYVKMNSVVDGMCCELIEKLSGLFMK
ncbi:MAG: hypothetical protein HKM93_13300 [Desulfobacteraceae bacterium]|nr:hypothetical protein [Desulfobacteraceae bacterium]